VILLFVSQASTSLQVVYPPSIKGSYYSPPIRINAPTQYNISGILTFANPPNGCTISPTDGINYTNTIIVTVFGACDSSVKALKASSVNAIGLIIQNLDDANGNSALIPLSNPQLTLPAVIIRFDDGNILFSQYYSSPNTSIVVMLSPDVNNWQVFTKSGGFIAIETIFAAFSVIIISLIVFKWVQFIKSVGFELSLAQSILFLELIGNLMRLIIAISDPWFAFRFFNLAWASTSLTLTLPLTYSASVLIALYWFRILSTIKSKSLTSHLKGLLNWPSKIIGCSIVVFLFLLEISTDIARAVNFDNQNIAISVSVLIYLVLSFVVSGIFLYTGIRVLLWVVKAHRSKRSTLASRIAKLLIASTIGRLCIIVGAALLFPPYDDFIVFATNLLLFFWSKYYWFDSNSNFCCSKF